MQTLSQLVIDEQGYINPAALAKTLHTTTQSIATHSGISVSTISKKNRVTSIKTQQKLRDVVLAQLPVSVSFDRHVIEMVLVG